MPAPNATGTLLLAQREIEIMNESDHPNVIKLFEIYDEPKKMMLVMELVPGLVC